MEKDIPRLLYGAASVHDVFETGLHADGSEPQIFALIPGRR
jgi:hypothetical protein